MLGTATAIDIEEVLSQAGHSDFHIFVADVIKSFDTVDRDILDCTLGRLGLPVWFRKVYFFFLFIVMFVFGLSLLLVWVLLGSVMEAFLRDAPLSMVFNVALYAPWCRYLESQVGISPSALC